ncbi:MAG: glycoside hydrolase family 31 protein [Bacteroidota bacterium]|nr:glycoside hydrolase family 31 protein [Bacteroidota bacterium]
MKKNVLFFLLLMFFSTAILFGQTNDPLPAKGAEIVSGNARFTVLTPRVIRMEWDSTGTFCDNASFIAVNRKLPVPEFKVKRSGKYLTVKTSEIELKYKINSGRFTSQNLSVTYLDKRNAFVWKPGEKQKGNLKGTYRTLDGCNGAYHDGKSRIPIEDGLLSTDGWTLINDSKGFLFDKSDWPWVEERKNQNGQDWYFMAYGKNYKEALKEYTEFAGKVPMPPRYAFGYWWSRYWNYSDNELRNLIGNFRRFNIPLDVLVIDMDWHGDNVDSKQTWTGWTWNGNLFPDYKDFLQWLKKEQVKTTLNLHPADGVAPFEDCYADFAKAMGVDPASKKTIPYEGSNKKFMETLFNQILHKYQQEGIDFWWLDWQQWPNDRKLTNLSNTWWLNYMFFTDMERNGDKRPMLYHRWGGLGNHRYQIGFSGDTYITWNSLAFQPYFTNTASNVLYTYWSHDIGGHMPFKGNKDFDPELYVRWMQYGALSPIFRTHSTKNMYVNKEPWNFKGEYYDAIQNSILLRYRLVPYIYTMARKTYDEGIGLCRPLYYDYPDDQQAYADSTEYMFGDNMLVAPIGKPMENGASKVKVWLPEGNDWYEWNTGTMLKGGQEIEREFSLDEYPLYVKAGAVIPMYRPGLKNLESAPKALEIDVFPGKGGEMKIYDDSGLNKDYAKEYSFTNVSSTVTGSEQKITINPVEGSYTGMPESRDYYVKVWGAGMPEKVTINGKEIPYSTTDNDLSWRYIGSELSFEISLKGLDRKEKAEIEITYGSNQGIDLNNGLVKELKVFSKKCTEAKAQGKLLNFVNETIGKCEETNREIEYDPQNFYKYIKYFIDNKDKAFDSMK